MPTKPRERATVQDSLQSLAHPLQPRRYPVYDWARRVWQWVPPWADDDRPEPLGASYPAAARALRRLLAKTTCPHGQPLARRCDECRARVVHDLQGDN